MTVCVSAVQSADETMKILWVSERERETENERNPLNERVEMRFGALCAPLKNIMCVHQKLKRFCACSVHLEKKSDEREYCDYNMECETVFMVLLGI